VLLREGSTDNNLMDLLGALLVSAGADEAIPDVRSYGGTTADKLERLLNEGASIDLIFIHRDADRAGYSAREAEIFDAANKFEKCPPVIPVTPTTMTESWLLLDEAEIRAVANNPSGRADLNLPTLQGVENVADAKQRLKEALVIASGLTGRRLEKFNTERNFAIQRSLLLQRLDLEGSVSVLSAFCRLTEDIESFILRTPRTEARTG
jgi:hypothetical protein